MSCPWHAEHITAKYSPYSLVTPGFDSWWARCVVIDHLRGKQLRIEQDEQAAQGPDCVRRQLAVNRRQALEVGDDGSQVIVVVVVKEIRRPYEQRLAIGTQPWRMARTKSASLYDPPMPPFPRRQVAGD